MIALANLDTTGTTVKKASDKSTPAARHNIPEHRTKLRDQMQQLRPGKQIGDRRSVKRTEGLHAGIVPRELRVAMKNSAGD